MNLWRFELRCLLLDSSFILEYVRREGGVGFLLGRVIYVWLGKEMLNAH